MTKRFTIKQIAALLTDDRIVNPLDLYEVIKKENKDHLHSLLNEPYEEKHLRRPIIRYFNYRLGEEYIDAESEVKTSEGKVIDVCIFHESTYIKILPYIVTIEIKAENTKRALDAVFEQAENHLQYAESSYVAISPIMFIERDDLQDKMRDYKGIGVIVVDRSNVKLILRDSLKKILDERVSWIEPDDKTFIYEQIPHHHFIEAKKIIRKSK